MLKISSVKTIVLLLALHQAAAQTGPDPADECKLSNDFKYEVCGEDAGLSYDGTTFAVGKTCCSTKQACVGPVTVKTTEDKDAFECSSARKLEGMKVIKIFIIPAVFLIVFIVFIVVMLLKLNLMTNHVTKAGVVLIVFTWPLLLSQVWYHGVWTAFLAITVAFLSNCVGMPKWVYRLAWAMQIFQVVVLLGPTETFHVPIFNQSLAGASTKLIHTAFGLDTVGNEASCSTFYEDYFKKLAIELSEKESNPDELYMGLCGIGWLSYIQFCLIAQSVILIAMVLLSAPYFLDASVIGKPAAERVAKVVSSDSTGGAEAAPLQPATVAVVPTSTPVVAVGPSDDVKVEDIDKVA